MNKFNFDSLCMLLITITAIVSIFGTIAYYSELKNKCVMQAMAKDKTADDIKKICYER